MQQHDAHQWRRQQQGHNVVAVPAADNVAAEVDELAVDAVPEDDDIDLVASLFVVAAAVVVVVLPVLVVDLLHLHHHHHRHLPGYVYNPCSYRLRRKEI